VGSAAQPDFFLLHSIVKELHVILSAYAFAGQAGGFLALHGVPPIPRRDDNNYNNDDTLHEFIYGRLY
jgi:hypothetical protein